MKSHFSFHRSDTTDTFRIHYFRHKLLPLLLLIITLFLILSIVIFNIVERTISNKLNNDSTILLSQTKRSFESVINEIYALTLILTYDTTTVEKIQNCLESTRIHFSDINDIQTSVIVPLVATRDYIDSIYIYFDNPNRFFIAGMNGLASLDSYSDTSWYESVISPLSVNKRIWSETRTYSDHRLPSLNHNVVTLYQRNLNQNGIIVLNLDQDYFNHHLDSMCNYEGQVIYILDESGSILFSTEEKIIFTDDEMKDLIAHQGSQNRQSDYFLSSAESDFIPKWTFVSIVPKGSLYAPIHQIMLLIFFTMIIACVITIILTTIRVWQSYRSIHRILHFIEDIKKDPCAHSSDKKATEYEFIVESLVEAYTRESSLKQELLELELKSLQSQINPHFLLNTLQSIFWTSFQLTNSYNPVSKMIENLNTMLGYLLESEHKLIPMEKELRTLESYISIQQVRTNNKFEIQWDVPESLHSCYTGKLLFQPLLENSIIHGFKGAGHWILRFKMRMHGQSVIVTIVDNGIGIPKPELEKIKQQLLVISPIPVSHIGIYNSNRRLQLLFGSQYHITISSKEGMGTLIRLRLPLITDENIQQFNTQKFI